MTNEFYETEMGKETHSLFGGLVYKYDYDEKLSMCDIAERIASDFRFDKRCKHNLQLRSKSNK